MAKSGINGGESGEMAQSIGEEENQKERKAKSKRNGEENGIENKAASKRNSGNQRINGK